MADFPTSLPDLSATTYLNGTLLKDIHPVLHNTLNEELDAVITKVGIDSSADTTSLDYKLKNTSSSNPGHKHTLANGATDVTASAAELNIMDGVTSTTAELNTLDGITATVTELNLTDGLGDAWTSFTPAWSGITEGSGANVGAYKLIGKTVIGYASFTVAADSTVGATSLGLPVTAATNIAGGSFPIGFVVFEDSGTGYFQGLWIAAGEIRVSKSDATYTTIAAISSTVPMTWTTGDKIRVNFCYESA